MVNKYAVIMAGGKGERFWPASTSKKPKQLLALVGGKALIAQAVERVADFIPPENVFVVTNTELVSATAEAAPMLPLKNIVGEPMGRDTAAAVACGAALVKACDPNGVFCILTADQVMGDLDRFKATLDGALELAAANDYLMTIGIEPTFPSTGFGYIESGEALATPHAVEFRKAQRFVEKPDEVRAQKYIDSGKFYWNSGMFIWSIASLEKAFAKHCPAMKELMDQLTEAARQGEMQAAMDRLYPDVTRISIDYALMEKADNIVMACGTFYWDDVGSWPALTTHFDADADNNTIIGNAELVDSKDNIVYSKDRLTALLGVEGLIVVQADGVTMVCPKDRAQDIKQLVHQVRDTGNYDALI